MQLLKQIAKRLFSAELTEAIRYYKSLRNKPFNFSDDAPRYMSSIVHCKDFDVEIIDRISFKFMYEEIFEKEIYFFKTNTDKPVIIDGGANIGLSTIYLKLLFPNSIIIAFEPDPDIFKVLNENINRNNLSGISLEKLGLWNQNCKLAFCQDGSDAGHIDLTNESTNIIQATSLRPYLEQNKIDFLKLDIEGSELVVLNDIKDLLKNVERLFVEYHSFKNETQHLVELLDIIRSAGYRFNISSPSLNSPQPLNQIKTYRNMDMLLNIFAFRNQNS